MTGTPLYERITYQFGSYQKFLYGVVSLGVFVPGIQNMAGNFLQYTPPVHNCSRFQDIYNFTTVATEFELICDKSSINTLITSGYFLGFFLGSLCGGLIADNYGRKVALLIGLFGNLVSSVLASS